MKFRLILLAWLFASFAQAQDPITTYLMYERINGQTINDSTNEVLAELTLFIVDGILTRTDSKAITRDFSVLDNKDRKKINWEVNTTGANIELKNQTRKIKGRIVTDFFIDSVLFVDREVKFILIPIELGFPIKLLQGRYVPSELNNINNNYTIDFGDMIEKGSHKGLQKTSVTWRIESQSETEYGVTKYSNSKYNNLIYVGGLNQFLQPVMSDAKTEITFNLFPAQFERPYTMLKSVIKLNRI